MKPWTHQRSSNRRSKETSSKPFDSLSTIPQSATKTPKIVAKCLDVAFSAASEDQSPESDDPNRFSPESDDHTSFSPVSEIIDGDQTNGSSEIVVPGLVSSIDPSAASDSGEIIGDCKDHGISNVEVVADLIRGARIEMLNSGDLSIRSKRILDAVIMIAFEDLDRSPDERNGFSKLESEKVRVVLLCVFLWMVSVSAVTLLSSGAGSSFSDSPPPT